MDKCALTDLNLEAREEKGREWQLAQVSDKSGHASCPSKRIRLACGWCGLTGRVSAGCGLVRVEASDLLRQRAASAGTCLLSALALVVSTDSGIGVTHSRAPTEPWHPSKSQGGARS